MSQIENQVNSLVLGYFSKINANVVEKNGLFDVEIPQEYSKIFGTTKLKITFDAKLSDSNDYVLVSPGSNILLSILNKCIDFGPIITAKLNSNKYNSKIIRFYFYVIFESIKSETKLLFVDVDVNTKKILDLSDNEIILEDGLHAENNLSEVIDDCYIAAMDNIEQIIKKSLESFKNIISKSKNEEIKNIDHEYKMRLEIIQKKSIQLQSMGKNNVEFQNIVDEHNTVREEEEKVRKNLDNKYKISVDFALIASIIVING